MNKTLIASMCILAFTCTTTHAVQTNNTNPFESASTLPLEAPPFDKIKDSDYLPAFNDGMKEQLKEIEVIANNPAPPTFENTIVAMEKSGRTLERVSEAFFAIVQANTNPTLDNVQETIAPKLAEHRDAIVLNPKLFDRIKAIYDTRDKLKLDQESSQLINVYYEQFIHAGANLNSDNKAKLQTINKKLASLETTFQQKLLAGTKLSELNVTDKSALAGLSQNELNALAHEVNGKTIYTIPLQNTTQQPLLQSLKKRNIREKLFDHSWNRTERNDKNDTRDTIATIAKLRAEKAALFGYPNFAAYTLYDQMAQNPTAVNQFLNQLIPPTTKRTTADADEIQAVIDHTHHFNLKPWDWNFYAEKIRKDKFDLDQNEVKPYFEINQVLENGVFYAANQLYGITFKERHDIPVYHPDVRVFDVYDKDNSVLGMLYLDYFKRDNKTGGAWMSNFVQQSTVLGTKPVIYNVTNFTKPAKGEPALLTSDDVTTMFHEFGHALHGLFSNNKYPLSNSNIARDFVEMPSQFNEHWAFYPEVLQHYAKHYQTAKPMPQELIDKITQSKNFNQGYSIGEIVAAASLDMQWHQIPANAAKQNVNEFEQQALEKTKTNFTNVPPRYRSTYFLHIWANGYSAGYYAYLWSEMLDDDIYDWFKQHGGMTKENGQRLRDLILSRGHTEDYNTMFKSFYGKDPEIGPMLKHRGL